MNMESWKRTVLQLLFLFALAGASSIRGRRGPFRSIKAPAGQCVICKGKRLILMMTLFSKCRDHLELWSRSTGHHSQRQHAGQWRWLCTKSSSLVPLAERASVSDYTKSGSHHMVACRQLHVGGSVVRMLECYRPMECDIFTSKIKTVKFDWLEL